MPEVVINRFGGINNKAPSERIESGWARRDKPLEPAKVAKLESGTNVDIDDSGGILMRQGETLRIAGAATSLWADNEIALMVQGGALKRVHPDYSMTTLVTGVAEDCAFIRVGNNVYMSDSAGLTKVITPSGVRSWGLPVPGVPATVSLVDGSLHAGTYQVVTTYVRSNGQESGAGLSTPVTTEDNDGIQITWDQPTDTDITYVNMYVSSRDGDTMFLAVKTPVGDGTATYTGGVMASPLHTQWLEAPPAGHLYTLHKGRILIAAGHFIQSTTPLGFELFDPTEFMDIDGSKITLMESLGEVVVVGTERSVIILKGNDLKSMQLEKSFDSGVIPGSGVVVDGNDALGDAKFSGQNVVLFVAAKSIIAGLPNGSFVNLTEADYEVTTSRVGTAIFRNFRDTHQYMVVQRS